MIFSRFGIEVPATGLFKLDPWLLDAGVSAHKLTIQVAAENIKGELAYGPCIIQTTESEQHVFEDDLNTSQLLRLGFNSRGFVTPITGFRARTPSILEFGPIKPALIDFTFYG